MPRQSSTAESRRDGDLRTRVPALVWLLWAVAAAASVQLAPNPLYVTVVIAIAALVVESHGAGGPLGRAFPVLVGAGVAFGGLRLVLTALTSHPGGSQFFSLPQATLPQLLGGFTVGGSVEVSVVARAAAEGWALVGVLAAFGAFNSVVSHYELVQAAPRAFYEVGLAVTVALAFVPSTVGAIAAVREADRARTGGRAVRRGRLLRQVVPILESGLEKAVSLSESMDSRGFGRGQPGRGDVASGWLSLVALLLLAASFIALIGRANAIAAVCAIAGAVSLVATIAVASRATQRVRYRRRRPTAPQWAIAAIAWAAPAGLAALAARSDTSLAWPDGADVHLPHVNLVALLFLAALCVPAIRPKAVRGVIGTRDR